MKVFKMRLTTEMNNVSIDIFCPCKDCVKISLLRHGTNLISTGLYYFIIPQFLPQYRLARVSWHLEKEETRVALW